MEERKATQSTQLDEGRMTRHNETIYALATGRGKSAIAVVRVSGPECSKIVNTLCRARALPPRSAVLTSVMGIEGHLIDRALVISFPRPRSYTGEDMLEFQITGSPAVIASLLRALSQIAGVRSADAGEFALRAFENGKLDLVEVEGLAALIEAETETQLWHAQSMAAGAVSECYERVRQLLLRALADVTAMLDFSDVEDAEAIHMADIFAIVEEAKSILRAMLADFSASERLKDGIVVVIAGSPNAGKSTLFNRLAKREIALTSPIPGTTRDSLEFFADVCGYPVTFVDTAGIRKTDDPLEIRGVARSITRIEDADIVLWLSEDRFNAPEFGPVKGILQKVRTKSDLTGRSDIEPDVIAVSALTGSGMSDLVSAVGKFARNFFQDVGTAVVGTKRQEAEIRRILDVLSAVPFRGLESAEILAEDLSHAARCMERLTGRIGVEEVLGEVFGRLCIGK